MKIDVLGVQINTDYKAEVLEQIKNKLTGDKSIFIVTPYSESIVAAQKDEEFRNVLNSADIALPDGAGIQWAAHFLKTTSPGFQPPSPGLERGLGRGRTIFKLIISLFAIIFNPKSLSNPILERISGSDFVWDLARLASENNYSIFLLGGFGDTPALAAAKLKSKFPNLKIAGTLAPSPGLERGWGEVVQTINNSSADLLFVALGPIHQEKWIAENLPKLNVKLAIGLGGTFDYLAGKRPPAPQIMRQAGLEWLWRLITQPWRAGRIFKGIFGLIYYCVKKR